MYTISLLERQALLELCLWEKHTRTRGWAGHQDNIQESKSDTKTNYFRFTSAYSFTLYLALFTSAELLLTDADVTNKH